MIRTVARKPQLLPGADFQTLPPPARRRANSAIKTDDSADSNLSKHVANASDFEPGDYTVQQVAELARMSRQRLYRMIRDGEIEARLATGGPRKWMIPAQEAWPLIHDDPFE